MRTHSLRTSFLATALVLTILALPSAAFRVSTMPLRPPLRKAALSARGITSMAAADSSVITNLKADSPKAYPPTPSLLELARFALPTLAIYISAPVMSSIDTATVSRASGLLELASLGPATAICDTTITLLSFLAVATTNLLASARGEESAARATSITLVISLAIGTALMLPLLLWAPQMCSTFAQGSPDLVPFAIKYTRIRTLALPFALLTMVGQAACIGRKDSLTPMVAVMLGALANVVGDWVMVCNMGLGVAGAAWATVGSTVLAASVLLVSIWRRTPGLGALLRKLPSRSEIRNFLTFGPFLFVLCMKMVTYNSCMFMAVGLGAASVAAHQILWVISKLCFVFGDALSSTSQAFIPAFWNGDRFDDQAAYPTIVQVRKMGVILGVLCATLVGVFCNNLSFLFTSDASIEALMRSATPMVCLGMSAHGSIVAAEGCLIAKRKLTFLCLIYALGFFLIWGGMAHLNRGGGSLVSLWGLTSLYQFYRLILFLGRNWYDVKKLGRLPGRSSALTPQPM